MLLCDSYALKRISIQALYDYKNFAVRKHSQYPLISIQALYDYKEELLKYIKAYSNFNSSIVRL